MRLRPRGQQIRIRSQVTTEERLERVGRVLTREADDHCARIATAAEWLFDAEYQPKSATTLMQTAIALEALHGGGERDPIRSTLANRIAYSLGVTAAERTELMSFVHRFHDTRSSVVHRGASRLNGDQPFNWMPGRTFCRKRLRHEMRLLGKG
jgi:hypothetical protein